MFKKPFSFEGRIRRTEYALGIFSVPLFILFSTIISFLFGLLLRDVSKEIISLILILPFTIILIWFLLAQAVKRSHDIGNSGWYILIPFYRLYLFFADSQFRPNKYGTNPKNLGNENEIDTIGQIVD